MTFCSADSRGLDGFELSARSSLGALPRRSGWAACPSVAPSSGTRSSACDWTKETPRHATPNSQSDHPNEPFLMPLGSHVLDRIPLLIPFLFTIPTISLNFKPVSSQENSEECPGEIRDVSD